MLYGNESTLLYVQYVEEIDSLKLDIQNAKNHLNSLNTMYGNENEDATTLDGEIGLIEKNLKLQLDEINKWKTGK